MTHAIPIRRPDANPRPDIVVATVLGSVGAVIGGAVAWSISSDADPVLTSFIGAALGTLFLCVLFQFVVPVSQYWSRHSTSIEHFLRWFMYLYRDGSINLSVWIVSHTMLGVITMSACLLPGISLHPHRHTRS